MSNNIQYPTWTDVGVSKLVLEGIRNIETDSGFFDYLVLNRIFRFNIRANYVYVCHSCGFEKKTGRHYEDYSSCEGCGSNFISSKTYWRMGKDQIVSYNSNPRFTVDIIQRMINLYSQYFRAYPPNDFIKCWWEWDNEMVEIPNADVAYGKNNNEPKGTPPSNSPVFVVKFCCGEVVKSNEYATSVSKAALLCPFLWDDCFDWKYLSRKDSGCETHILPLLNVWKDFHSRRRPKKNRMPSASICSIWDLQEEPQQGQIQEVPQQGQVQEVAQQDQGQEAQKQVQQRVRNAFTMDNSFKVDNVKWGEFIDKPIEGFKTALEESLGEQSEDQPVMQSGEQSEKRLGRYYVADSLGDGDEDSPSSTSNDTHYFRCDVKSFEDVLKEYCKRHPNS